MKQRRRKPKKPVIGSEQPRKGQAAAREGASAGEGVGRRWVVRGLMALSPLLLLAILELALRLGGFGYPTSFLLPVSGGAQPMLRENSRFGWRFFPPSVARTPEPILIRERKPPGAVRVIVFGESAAMGDPEPSYGLSRQLDCILQGQHPGQRVEVVNAAMTAINSHVVREIARDCARLKADFWVVYMGNNEVIGPFGAGTIFGRQAPGLGTVRLTLALKATRIGELIGGLAQGSAPPEWAGMEMFLGQQVRRDDPRLKNVYANFAGNLVDVVKMGKAAGAKVLLATVPVNLKDSPPFGSAHRNGLGAAERAAWETDFAEGLKAETNGAIAEALSAYQEAAKIDDQSAELAFCEGQCRLRQGEYAAADADFRQALELDTLRFRADARLNEIIRKTAAAEDAELLDAAAECARGATNGIPGDELFYDHVHLNFTGNYLVAALVALKIERNWPGKTAPNQRIIPASEVARRLAFTDFDRRRILEEMKARFEQPPFGSQSDFRARDEDLARRIAALRAAPGELIPKYEEAIKLAPKDWMLHANFARLLEDAVKDGAAASAEWREVTRLMPHWPEAWLSLGHIADDGGRYAEAESCFRETLKLDPGSVEAWNELGLVAGARGNSEEAIQCYRKALRLKPGYSAARINLAVTLSNKGDVEGAEAEYRQVLGRETNNVNALNNLGILLARRSQGERALSLYQRALSLKPDYAAAHFNMARTLVQLGRHEEAIRHYEVVAKERPEMADAQLELGLELARMGKGGQALGRLSEAARLKPDWADARFNYGIALAKAQRYREAIEEFRATLRLNPDHPVAARALEQATRALGESKSP